MSDGPIKGKAGARSNHKSSKPNPAVKHINAAGEIPAHKGAAGKGTLAGRGKETDKWGNTHPAFRMEFPRQVAPMAFAKELLAIRATLGISQEILAHILRVTVRTVSRWEKAETQPTNPGDIDRIKRLKALVTFGLKVYSKQGLRSLLAEDQPVFGDKSGIDMLAFDEYERVAAAIEADYEGLGY